MPILLLLVCAVAVAAEAPPRDPFAGAETVGDSAAWPRLTAIARHRTIAVVRLTLGGESALAAPGEEVTLGSRRFLLRTVQGEEATLAEVDGQERRLRLVVVNQP